MCGLIAGYTIWRKTLSGTVAEGDPRVTVLEDVKSIHAYPEAGMVLIGCRIHQENNGAGLFEFSRRTQGWAGSSEGANDPHFIIKTDVPLDMCNRKLLEAGARVRRQFPVHEAVQKMKSGHVTQESYLDGTPVMVALRWRQDGRLHQVPFQRFFMEKVFMPDGEEIVKPFTPHFVYHGSGVLNVENNRGCIVCQQDCSGGLICNNQEPCVRPVPLLKPDWEMLPPPGTLVTLVIYVMPVR
jgi:hypothetical protein